MNLSNILQWKNPPVYNRLTLLHSERPKLYTILAFMSAVGLRGCVNLPNQVCQTVNSAQENFTLDLSGNSISTVKMDTFKFFTRINKNYPLLSSNIPSYLELWETDENNPF